MCDYSLCGLPNRLAVEGEDLEVHRFSTGSVGLRSPFDHSTLIEQCIDDSTWSRVKRFFGLAICQLAEANPAGVETAVCVPPGADLIVKGIPAHLQHRYGIEEDEGVKFVQTSADVNSYRDAVQFENGRTISLQDLPDGLRIEVLSLARVFAMDIDDVAGRSAAIQNRNVA
jgi:hypothetical protein